MEFSWNENWRKAQQHHFDFWRRKGFVLEIGVEQPLPEPRENVENPGPAPSVEDKWTNVEWRAKNVHWILAITHFIGDRLPVAVLSIGPGSLALMLGSEPGLSESTVWYHSVFEHDPAPEKLPPLKLDPENRWLNNHLELAKLCVANGKGKYLTGFPDLIENFDCLASLRDNQVLLLDLYDRPEWVKQKIREINQVWFEAYTRIYDIISGENGESVYAHFNAYSPGKTAKVQCDAAAMLSPDAFREFVVPSLTEQCEWLDNSMFHLDGPECICHLDHLLNIDALDAVQWTAGVANPDAGQECYFDMYRKILDSGKGLQIATPPDRIETLLKTFGNNGLFLRASVDTPEQAREIIAATEKYR